MLEKKIIEQLVKLQILSARYFEKKYDFKFYSGCTFETILCSKSLMVTYLEAIENLIKFNIKNNIGLFKEELESLKNNILESNIKDLRMGDLTIREPFTEKEYNLNTYRLVKTIDMISSSTYTITEAKKIINSRVKEASLKKACQDNILLNTRKISTLWLVDIEEVRAHWNIPQDFEKIAFEQEQLFQEYKKQLSDPKFQSCISKYKSLSSKYKLPGDAAGNNYAIEIFFNNQTRIIVYRTVRGAISVIQKN